MKRQLLNIFFNTHLGIISPEKCLSGVVDFNSFAAVTDSFTTTFTTTTTTTTPV